MSDNAADDYLDAQKMLEVWYGKRRPMFEEWDNTLSFQEGWGLFEHHGDVTEIQLQAYNEAGILLMDDEAWRLVLQRASYGSALHQGALDILRLHSNAEFQRINNFRRTRGSW